MTNVNYRLYNNRPFQKVLSNKQYFFFYLLSALWKVSTIIAGNLYYYSNLHQFLKPAAGSHPQWLLCYRASTHGWSVSTFHNRCDGKPNTVTIVKAGQYVFGGYTDIPWGKYLLYVNFMSLLVFAFFCVFVFCILRCSG